MVTLIMTRGVEVDTSEEKQVTLTGVIEELGFKFEGKEQWIIRKFANKQQFAGEILLLHGFE